MKLIYLFVLIPLQIFASDFDKISDLNILWSSQLLCQFTSTIETKTGCIKNTATSNIFKVIDGNYFYKNLKGSYCSMHVEQLTINSNIENDSTGEKFIETSKETLERYEESPCP